MPRVFRTISWRDAQYRVCSPQFDTIKAEIKKQRRLLEQYIIRHERFLTSFEPVEVRGSAPPIVAAMQEASIRTGTGPMAAVAGAIAQFAAAAAIDAGAEEAIVENGGDIYCLSASPLTVALHTGTEKIGNTLGLRLLPDEMPLSVCSSSSTMGHSISLGKCDLATVIAKDAPLADAAATLACNLVRRESDIPGTLERVAAIEGISGLILVKGEKIGMIGDLPRVVRQVDPEIERKVTCHAGGEAYVF